MNPYIYIGSTFLVAGHNKHFAGPRPCCRYASGRIYVYNTGYTTDVCIHINNYKYVTVITWSGGICLIYTHDARGRTAPKGECVYIRQIPTDHVIIITVWRKILTGENFDEIFLTNSIMLTPTFINGWRD